MNYREFGVKHKCHTLKNGSIIRLLGRKGAPIHIQACIHAGSRYNSIPGQAHFLEHMLVSGSRSFPTKLSLSSALEQVGGSFDAVTDPDFIRITVSIPHKRHLDLAVNILNEILTAALHESSLFENEKSVILSEINEKRRNIPLYLMNSLMNLAFVDYTLHFNGLGTKESVSAMNIEDVTKHAKENITSSKTIYVVSGDIEMEEISASLSIIKLPNDLKDAQIELPKQNNVNHFIYENKDSEQTDILIGFRCDTNSLEDFVGLLLIQQMFMGRRSPFIQKLRYERGLVYGGSATLWDFFDTSIFGVRTASSPENIKEVFDTILNIINQTQIEGVRGDEFEILKIKTEGFYRFSLQTSREWLDAETTIIRHNRDRSDDSNALDILSCIQEMNIHTINEILKKYFSLNNAYCVVLGSLSNETIEHIQKILY